MIRRRSILVWGVWAFAVATGLRPATAGEFAVLRPEAFVHHVEHFNAMDEEKVKTFIPNAQSWDWLCQNVPLFECPDQEVEEIYYFRWWSFRKHLVQTPQGFVFTEFLVPVTHAGAFNTISCAAGHHIAEGRWLRDPQYLDDYIRFWFRGPGGRPQPHLHRFSIWIAAAVLDRYRVNADKAFVVDLLDDLAADYRAWEEQQRLANGLFWQYDVRDGMEESISGSRTRKQARPTINAYMFANARAIATIARMAGREDLARQYDLKAAELKRLTQSLLWDAQARFFKVRYEDGRLADVREAIGFIPWCFNLPDPGREEAWVQLTDPKGFRAQYGITTAEQRHPSFRSHGCCRCEWDGAVWPFATSQTLVALANVLRDYPVSAITPKDYFEAFGTYVRCHRMDGRPYIGEYLDETTGQWLKGREERGRYYNHSTFADLVITGVVGLRPRADDVVEVHPLLPPGTWDWFCLDGVRYHGRTITILWDRDGRRYRRGVGMNVLSDGQVIGHCDTLGRVTGRFQ